MIEAYFHGDCEPNIETGLMAHSIIVYMNDMKIYQLSKTYHRKDRAASNNISAYNGVISVFHYISDENFTDVKIYGDSKLVIEQLNGNWEVKEGKYKISALYAKEELKFLNENQNRNIILEWIPKEKNEECRNLSRQHYE
jgi:ribonuclease HI